MGSISGKFFGFFQNDHVRNVVDVYKPVVVISNLGIMCTVAKNKKIHNFELSVLKLFLLLAVLVITCLHLFLIPGTILYIEKKMRGFNVTNYKFNFFKKPSQHFITKLVNPLSVATTTIISRLLVVLKMHRQLPGLISKFLNLDQQLGYDQELHKKDHKYLICMTFVLILVAFPFETYSLFYTFRGDWIPTVLFAINNFNNFSLCCVEFQFFSFCFLIYCRFKFINNKMMQYENNIQNIDNHNLAPKSTNKSKCILVDTLGQDKKLPKSEQTPKNWDEKILAQELHSLRQIHKSFVALARKVNKTYDVQLLLAVCCGGVNVLLNLYYSIFGGFETPTVESANERKPERQPYDVLNDLIWASYYFVRFVFVCTISHKVTKEANLTKFLLSNLFNRMWSKSVKEELWNFYNNISSNKLQVTACGFFRYNLALITTAIATGTTYLVILAQFHKGA